MWVILLTRVGLFLEFIQNYYRSMVDKHSKLSFFNLPSLEKFPEVNHSLKLINTINVIPNHSSLQNVEIPHSSLLDQEDSLAERISHVNTAAQSAKKRKIGCTCKKTFCLKMYCECFSQGKQCGEDCACTNCKNAPGFEQTIMNAKMGVKEGGTRNCALSQKRCNCKKSHCLKRYCECYNAGVGCSQDCKCQSCQNKPQQQISVQQIYKEQQVHQQHNQSNGDYKPMGLQSEFPSINAYMSMDDLSKFYN